MFAIRKLLYVLWTKFLYLNKRYQIMKNLFLFLTLCFSLTLFGQNNQTMPEVILKDLAGKNRNVADYSKSGKITIISFWATWCTPCKKELTNINDLLDDWKEKYQLELVAISTDNSRNVLKVKPYVDGQGWTFDCLLDVNEDLKRLLNAPSIPYTVLLDQNGNIVYTHTGYLEGDEFVLEEKIKALVAKK